MIAYFLYFKHTLEPPTNVQLFVCQIKLEVIMASIFVRALKFVFGLMYDKFNVRNELHQLTFRQKAFLRKNKETFFKIFLLRRER